MSEPKACRGDVIATLGEIDGITLVEILGVGAIGDELVEAQAWLANDEPLMNIGKPLPAGRVGQLVEIIKAIDEEEPSTRGVPGMVDDR